VYNEHGMAQRNGTGMFPREVVQKPLPPLVGRFLPSKTSGRRFAMNHVPLLPSEEEGRLNDMPLRENFVERVFGLRRKAKRKAWQFLAARCEKLHERMDPNAGRGTHARRLGPCPCGQGRQVPHRPQADPRDSHFGSRHGPQPILIAGQATTPR
jgi:hypothetical protein